MRRVCIVLTFLSIISQTEPPLPTEAAPTPVTAPADIPIILKVPVPFPNMEPFLGSVRDYALWDSRVFVFSGVYCLARFGYVVHKWWRATFGADAGAANAAAAAAAVGGAGGGGGAAAAGGVGAANNNQ